MLGGLEALPVLGFPILADLVLVVVAATVVLRAHRRAGLALVAGAGLALVASIAAPVLQLSTLGGVIWYAGSQPGQGDGTALWVVMMVMMLFAAWSPFLARTFELGTVIFAVVALVRRLPASARDDLGGAPPARTEG